MTARVLVTGGSSGIGWATATTLLKAGADVTVLDRVPPPENLAGLGYLECDLRQGFTAEVERWCADGAPLDGLVHSAGVCDAVDLEDESRDHLDWNYSINVYPAVLLTKQALGRLRASAAASVVLIGSVMGSAATSRSVGYIGTKGAIEALTRALAVELADDHIRVNCVAPGVVKTPLWRAVQLSLGRTEQQMAVHAVDRRIGKPVQAEQIASVIEFLLSPAASAVNGAVLPVDNGHNAVLPA